MSGMPRVAPFESCVVCLRGDTDTGLVVRGEAEFVVAFLHAQLGVPVEQATGTIEAYAERELGCEPGKIPDGSSDYAMRLCRDCARKAGVKVGTVSSGQLPGYSQGGES
jgi:hypothetical protein